MVDTWGRRNGRARVQHYARLTGRRRWHPNSRLVTASLGLAQGATDRCVTVLDARLPEWNAGGARLRLNGLGVVAIPAGSVSVRDACSHKGCRAVLDGAHQDGDHAPFNPFSGHYLGPSSTVWLRVVVGVYGCCGVAYKVSGWLELRTFKWW